MELLQLRYFHEVAQTQHMTNSAKRLGVAQPALTQAIRRLEGELDAKLFERAGRNIRLTPCGEALEAKVAPLLAAFDEIPLAIAQAKGQERDTVRIDVEAATSMTVDAIAAFRATVPQAAFVINQANSEGSLGRAGSHGDARRRRQAGRAHIPGVPRTHMPGHPQGAGKG